MRALSFTLALLLTMCIGRVVSLAHYDYRQAVRPYHGMVERGYNRGAFIDSANRRYAFLGAPYCASAASVILDRVRAVAPRYRGGASRRFIDSTAVSARAVLYGRAEIPKHSLAIWVRRGGGHVSFYVDRNGDALHTFDFNTSSGRSGSQFNGSWSGFRVRSLRESCSPLNPFRITHFVKVRYAN